MKGNINNNTDNNNNNSEYTQQTIYNTIFSPAHDRFRSQSLSSSRGTCGFPGAHEFHGFRQTPKFCITHQAHRISHNSPKVRTLSQERIRTHRNEKDSCPWPAPVPKPSATPMVWNISTGQHGSLPGCAPSQLPPSCSSAGHGRLGNILDFTATAENFSLASVLLLNPKHSRCWEGSELHASQNQDTVQAHGFSFQALAPEKPNPVFSCFIHSLPQPLADAASKALLQQPPETNCRLAGRKMISLFFFSQLPFPLLERVYDLEMRTAPEIWIFLNCPHPKGMLSPSSVTQWLNRTCLDFLLEYLFLKYSPLNIVLRELQILSKIFKKSCFHL